MVGPDDPTTRERRLEDDRREDPRRPRPGRRITDVAAHADSWLPVPVVADYLAVHHTIVDKWIDAGELRADRLNGIWRVKRSDLEAFVESRARSGPLS